MIKGQHGSTKFVNDRSSAMTAMPYIENNISGMNQSRPKRGSQFCHVQKISEDERSKAKWTAQQSRNC